MTPRQRVLAAVDRRPPDRIPVDLSGHRSSGIAAVAYGRLRRHLGLPDREIRVYDPIQQLAVVDEDVRQRFGVDTVELGRSFDGEVDWREWVLPDGSPCVMPAWALPERDEAGERWIIRSQQSGDVIAQMLDGSLYFEQTTWPYAEGDDRPLEEVLPESMWTAMASPPGPIAAGDDGAAKLAAGAERLGQSTDRAIIGLFGGNLLEMGQFLYRNDNFFMLLAGEPDRAHAFLDRVVEMHLANLERFLAAVGASIDIVLFGDDLGMQTGPQVSPQMYREFFKPRQQRMWRRAKELAPDVKIMLHCCGGVRELLDDLIDVGLDAINPVQVTCDGMNLVDLKRDFGDRLCFWGGGCDTRDVLPRATPAQVAEHVKRQCDVYGGDGGFVFQQVHNIMADVPPENIVAMYDAVREVSEGR